MKSEFGAEQFGLVKIFAAFRCQCGGLTAMARSKDGNAAILHQTPKCAAYEAIDNQEQALDYFERLTVVPLTKEFAAQLARSQAHC